MGRRSGSGRPSKMTSEVKQEVEEQMQLDDESTAYQLHVMLVSKGYNSSICTVYSVVALLWGGLFVAVPTANSYAKRIRRRDWRGQERM